MNTVCPRGPDSHYGVPQNLAFNLQAALEDIGVSKMRVYQGNVGGRELRQISDLVREYRSLLVGCRRPVVTIVIGHGRLLRKQSVRNHRIPVVQAIEILVKHSEATAHDGSLQRLPGESKSGREALVLVRKLTRQRKRRIHFRFWVDLKILADSEVQRQTGMNLIGVVQIESQVRDVERKPWLARTLEE